MNKDITFDIFIEMDCYCGKGIQIMLFFALVYRITDTDIHVQYDLQLYVLVKFTK